MNSISFEIPPEELKVWEDHASASEMSLEEWISFVIRRQVKSTYFTLWKRVDDEDYKFTKNGWHENTMYPEELEFATLQEALDKTSEPDITVDEYDTDFCEACGGHTLVRTHTRTSREEAVTGRTTV